MKFFIIRMNDFTPEEWPVVSLPYNKNSNAKQSKEACKKLIEELGSDDGIIIVGKLSHPTPKDMQGQILGIAFCGNTIHRTENVIASHRLDDPNVWKDGIGNNFRWPYGVAIAEALVFEPPYLDARTICDPNKIGHPNIFHKWYFSPQYKKLESDQSTALLKEFQNIPSRLKKLPQLGAQVELNSDEQQRTKGPPPSSSNSKSGQFVKKIYKEPITYTFRFDACDCWKIGLTGREANVRLKEINNHIPTEALQGKKWKAYKSKKWNDGQLAYSMEQSVLDILEKDHKVDGEIVYCAEKTLMSAWNKAIRQTKLTNT